ncbi:uncharacterized protein LOC141674570 [Apium graveolens]|uniref:uncharacterized protein LOC141674570 n=1 Tax=Apium graveolens TaxID=4045 RepID=UPI003D79D36C
MRKKEKVEQVRKAIGFEGAFAVDCQGLSGGIAMFWRNQNGITLQSYSNKHVDIIVAVHGWRKFRLTGLYGEPDRIGGKKGGCLYPMLLIRGFQETLDECNLHDIDLQGYPYTFERGQGMVKWIKIRLDRALVSSSWTTAFNEAKLVNLKYSTTDHCPILLEPVTVYECPRVKILKFENAWLREPVCKQIFQDTWGNHQNYPIQEKIRVCIQVVSAWGQNFTGNFKQRIAHWRRVINNTKGRRDEEAADRYNEACKNLNEALVQ